MFMNMKLPRIGELLAREYENILIWKRSIKIKDQKFQFIRSSLSLDYVCGKFSPFALM